MQSLTTKYSSKPQVHKLLLSYSDSFHRLVQTSDKIGLETQTGLKGILNNRTDQLLHMLDNLEQKSDAEILDSRHKGLTIFSIAVIGGVIFCIILIVLIMRKL